MDVDAARRFVGYSKRARFLAEDWLSELVSQAVLSTDWFTGSQSCSGLQNSLTVLLLFVSRLCFDLRMPQILSENHKAFRAIGVDVTRMPRID